MKHIELTDDERKVLKAAEKIAISQRAKIGTRHLREKLLIHFQNTSRHYLPLLEDIVDINSAFQGRRMSNLQLAFELEHNERNNGPYAICRAHIYRPESLPDYFEELFILALKVFMSKGNNAKLPSDKKWGKFTNFVNKMNGRIKFTSSDVAKSAYYQLFQDRYTIDGKPKAVVADAETMDLSGLRAQHLALSAVQDSRGGEKIAPRQNLRTGKPKYPYHGRGGPKDPDLL